MGQIFSQDNIPALVKASGTTATLAPTNLNNPTRITISGQQYPLSSTLTLNTSVTGLGGVDTGAITTNTLYYVYFCVDVSGAIGLVASLSSSSPTGFTSSRLLGKLRTYVGSSQINDVSTIGVTPSSTTWQSLNLTGFLTSNVVYSGLYRRVKTDIEVQFKIAFTGVNTQNGNATIVLPTSLGTVSIATTFLGPGSSRSVPAGTFEFDDTSSGAFAGIMTFTNASQPNTFLPVLIIDQGVDGVATTLNTVNPNANRPVIVAANDSIMGSFKAPITEWLDLYS